MTQLSLVPPESVAENARLGLLLRARFKRGGTEIGVARAKELMSGKPLTIETLKRMKSYFARHSVDKRSARFWDEEKPSAGRIAWLLWGGDEAQEWAKEMLDQLTKMQTILYLPSSSPAVDEGLF